MKPEKIEYDASTIRKFNPGKSLISIIIPTKNKIDLIVDCIQSVIDHTHIARYEILIADTGSTSENKKKLSDWIKNLDKINNLVSIKIIEYDYYNFSKINNNVVKNYLSKNSNYVIFCNNNIKLLNDAIDRCLHLFREKKNIGTVGIRLHYSDNSIQHNGMEMQIGFGRVVTFSHRNLGSYYTYDQNIIEVIGNIAAFLMIERSLFEKCYFNENYKKCYEDVELNLEILRLGRKNYHVGHAVAYHYESQTRNSDLDKNNEMDEDYRNHLLPFFKQHCVPLFFAQLFKGASQASRVGHFQTAVEICELLLKHAPSHADVHHLFGVVLGRKGDQVGAVKYIRQAIALNEAIPDYHYNLAEALRLQGQWKQAEQSYRQALRLAPNMMDAYVNLAKVLKSQDRLDEALACYQQALRLKPDHALIYFDMGTLLHQQGAYDAAIECYQRAIQLQPDLADAYYHLGMVLSHMENRLDEATQCYQQVLRYKPNSTEAQINLGKMLEQQGRIADARECYRQVQEIKADYALFRLHIESLCPPVPASNAVIDTYREALQARLMEWREPSDLRLDLELLHASGFEPPPALAYQGRDDRPLKEAWAALFKNLLPEVESSLPASGRQQVGFIVTRRHERAFLKGMAGILDRLSVDRFDLTVACSQQGSEARLRAGIHNPAVRYLPLPDRIDHSVERLQQARFSVLYHWEVGTDSFNYFLPFFRLAPVQCTGWGWPVTSGIPQMNYYLSAQHLETADSDAHYNERLIRFRRLPVYFHRPQWPESLVEREHFGLAAGQHLYVCTQNPRKIHPDFDELLAGVLRRDPHGVVVLIEDIQPAVTAALRQRLQAHLPDVIERVRFLPWLAFADYLRLLAAADVALDTPHFGGGITTYDALAVGLPIVTLPGAFSRGRYAYAAYRQMGLDAGIAADPVDYIERAVRFASEPDYRAAFSAQLREASAELFEDQEAVREFEAFLESALSSVPERR